MSKRSNLGRPRFLHFQLDARKVIGSTEFIVMRAAGLGVYVRLVAHAWANATDDGPMLRLSDRYLAAVGGVSEHVWKRLKPSVLALFEVHGDCVVPIGFKKQHDQRVRRVSRQQDKIPVKLRFSVLQRDGFRCVYCGRSAGDVELHVDHVRPWSMGGKTEMGNLTTACAECNIGKSDAPTLVNQTGQAQ